MYVKHRTIITLTMGQHWPKLCLKKKKNRKNGSFFEERLLSDFVFITFLWLDSLALITLKHMYQYTNKNKKTKSFRSGEQEEHIE